MFSGLEEGDNEEILSTDDVTAPDSLGGTCTLSLDSAPDSLAGGHEFS